MMIDSSKIITVTEAKQNFSKATRIADTHGDALVFKNNRPKYKLVNLEVEPDLELTDDEKIDIVARRILTRYKPAFLEFGDKEFYPTKEEKGARLGYTLISNHAFVDGNKRIGMYIMLTFLEVNGIRMDCTNDDVYQTGMAVADGSMGYEALLTWVKNHAMYI